MCSSFHKIYRKSELLQLSFILYGTQSQLRTLPNVGRGYNQENVFILIYIYGTLSIPHFILLRVVS